MKQRTHKFDVAAGMPPLRHTLPGERFDVDHSEVLCWLVSQSSIRQYVFDKARGLGLIVYDAETGTWAGVDHES
jgi:hypothetical protein